MRITNDGNEVIIDYLDGKGPTIYKTKVEALLGHVQHELDVTYKELLAGAEICDSMISRIRKGKSPMPPLWFLKLHEYSGISVRELREVSCTPYAPSSRRTK